MKVYIGERKNTKLTENTVLTTTICLKNKTFSLIDKVIKELPKSYSSRGKVVDEAVAYWVEHCFGGSENIG